MLIVPDITLIGIIIFVLIIVAIPMNGYPRQKFMRARCGIIAATEVSLNLFLIIALKIKLFLKSRGSQTMAER
jgi:hypothetical protein